MSVWDKLAYPLSQTELRRLTNFRSKIEATEFLGRTQHYVTGREASRLAYARYLYATHRLDEGTPPDAV